MFLSKDINPSKSVYYIGSKVISSMIRAKEEKFDFFDLYHIVNDNEKTNLSLFIYTVDWLYLLGMIDQNEDGELIRCF